MTGTIKQSPRVPLALQNVFITSCQDIEVHEAPNDLANKTFHFKSPRPWSPQKHIQSLSVRSFHLNLTRCGTLCSSLHSPRKKTQPKKADEMNPVTGATLPVPKRKPQATLAPQDYLNGILRSRGYATTSYAAMESGYYNKPTDLQQASYGSYLATLLRKGEYDMLRKCFAAGLSPNPSNQYGESMAHLACRLRSADGIKLMLGCGCDIRFVDDKGRTPLHDACWTHKPCFELIKIILEVDWKLLLVADSRGCQPLSYAPKQSWSDWLEFLASNRDVFWPRGHVLDAHTLPDLSTHAPNSRPVPNPSNALPLSVAKRIAEGSLSPEAARDSCTNSLEELIREFVEISTSSEDSDTDFEDDDSLFDSDDDE